MASVGCGVSIAIKDIVARIPNSCNVLHGGVPFGPHDVTLMFASLIGQGSNGLPKVAVLVDPPGATPRRRINNGPGTFVHHSLVVDGDAALDASEHAGDEPGSFSTT